MPFHSSPRFVHRCGPTALAAIAILAALRAVAAEGTAVDDVRAKTEAILDRVHAHEFHPIANGFTKDRDLGRDGIAELNDVGWKVRLLAIRDLLRLGPEAAPAIIEELTDQNPHVRQICAMVLGIEPTPAALDELHELLRSDPDPVVRSQAVVSLARIGSRDSLPILQERLANDQRDVRHQCEVAIYRIERQIAADDGLAAAYAALDESTFESQTVGSQAIDFELEDTRGKKWRLSDFRGRKSVVLIWIFADWCPVCHKEFYDLTGLQQRFDEHAVQVFTIECHDPFRSRVMVGQELSPRYAFTPRSPQSIYREKMWWTHLVDLAGAVGATYGVDPLAFTVHSEWINRPSTVIVDRDGVVRFAYHGTYWGDRPTIEQTLEMIAAENFEFEHPKRLKLPK